MKKQTRKKPTYFEGSYEDFGILLWQVTTKWRRQIESVLKPLDLTHTQVLLLKAISELTFDGTDVTQAELAREADLDITMTSQILRTLEQKGFIERRQRIGDVRSKFPHLTKLGSQLTEQAIGVIEEINSTFFECLRSDTKKCLDILQKLAL